MSPARKLNRRHPHARRRSIGFEIGRVCRALRRRPEIGSLLSNMLRASCSAPGILRFASERKRPACFIVVCTAAEEPPMKFSNYSFRRQLPIATLSLLSFPFFSFSSPVVPLPSLFFLFVFNLAFVSLFNKMSLKSQTHALSMCA